MPLSFSVTYNGQQFDDPRAWSFGTTEVPTRSGKAVKRLVRTYSAIVQFTGNASAGDEKTDLDTLRTKLSEPDKAFKVTKNGTDVISHAATDANVISGPRATFQLLEDGFGKGYGVSARLTVTVELDPVGAGPILARDEETRWTTGPDGLRTRVITGEIKVAGGNSAVGQLSTVTPATLSGFERTEDYAYDADVDLELTYTFTDVERADDPPGGAASGEWTTRARVIGSEETWVVSGSLTWAASKTPKESAVVALVKKSIPTDAVVAEQDIQRDFVKNQLRFTVTARRGFGKNTTLRYRRTITFRVTKSQNIRKSLSKKGKDKRQEFARPDVEVIDAGSHVAMGGYPAFPDFFLDAEDVSEFSEILGELEVGPEGKIVVGEVSWSHRYTILNEVEAGELTDASFEDLVGEPSEIADEDPRVGQASKARVA